ncbi:hypothetical protein Tco_0605937 [Tanacetum coccineum]
MLRSIKSVGTIKDESSGTRAEHVQGETLSENIHPFGVLPPLDQFDIYGDGSVKDAEKIIPQSIVASLTHDIFFRGCQTNFSVKGPKDVEIGDLYPEEWMNALLSFAMKFKKNQAY